MADEKMLNRMGATAKDPPDPMLVKWLEDREKRCTAEAAGNQARRNLEAAQQEIERWRGHFWGVALLCCVLAVAFGWLLWHR
jgi:uncharacterized protein involved in exopolysaccharide biosynthesis